MMRRALIDMVLSRWCRADPNADRPEVDRMQFKRYLGRQARSRENKA